MAVGGGFATPFLMPGQTDARALFDTTPSSSAAPSSPPELARAQLVSYLTLSTIAAWADRFQPKVPDDELFITLFCAMLHIFDSVNGSPRGLRPHGVILWTAPPPTTWPRS